MLLKTHAATALSLTYLFDYYISLNNPAYKGSWITRIIVFATAVILQYFIDEIGHTWKRYGNFSYPARNKYHSLPTMVSIGAGIGVAYYIITDVPELIGLFSSVMLLHWAEDLVTEGGVYLLGRKIRLPKALRVKYDNSLVNRATLLVVFAPIILFANPFISLFSFVLFMFVALWNVYAFLAV